MNQNTVPAWIRIRAKHWRLTWEYELAQTDSRESTWPKQRTLPEFDLWFDIEILDTPIDLKQFVALSQRRR